MEKCLREAVNSDVFETWLVSEIRVSGIR